MSLGVPVDRYCQPYCHDAAILVNRATQFGHCRDAGADLAGTVGNYNCKSNLFNRSVELFIWRRKCLTHSSTASARATIRDSRITIALETRGRRFVDSNLMNSSLKTRMRFLQFAGITSLRRRAATSTLPQGAALLLDKPTAATAQPDSYLREKHSYVCQYI